MSYPKQWEYEEVYVSELMKHPYYGTIDHLGLEGWELVGVVGSPSNGQKYIFKRPLNYKPRKG